MKNILLIVVMLTLAFIALATPILAQTSTPTPIPTNTPLPSSTPFPTYNWPTLTPITGGPIVWPSPTRPILGTAFQVPPPPNLGVPDLEVQPGFDAIGNNNSLSLGIYIVTIIVGFYGWMVINMPGAMRAMRIFTIIMFVLYGIYLIWKDSRYYPNSSGQGNFLEDYRVALRGGFRGGVRASRKERAFRENIRRRNR